MTLQAGRINPHRLNNSSLPRDSTSSTAGGVFFRFQTFDSVSAVLQRCNQVSDDLSRAAGRLGAASSDVSLSTIQNFQRLNDNPQKPSRTRLEARCVIDDRNIIQTVTTQQRDAKGIRHDTTRIDWKQSDRQRAIRRSIESVRPTTTKRNGVCNGRVTCPRDARACVCVRNPLLSFLPPPIFFETKIRLSHKSFTGNLKSTHLTCTLCGLVESNFSVT